MPQLASIVATTPHSGIRAMGALARNVEGVIHLEAGDPDFTTPSHIIDAAAAGAHDGFTKYTAAAGYARLRELIAEKVRERNGFACDPEQVVVTTGACGGLFTTFLTLLDHGDDVLIPDPGWSNYPAMLHVLRARAKRYRLDPADDFAIDLDALASDAKGAKAIVLNSPGNPAGNVLDRQTLTEVMAIAESNDLWVLSDECYDQLIFEGEHVSAGAIAGHQERLITAFSFSKSYAMTGWRLGYLIAPVDVATEIAKMQEPVVANASSVSQIAAEAALSGPQDCVEAMCEEYRSRLRAATALLDDAGVGYVQPRGAFFLMVDVSAAGESLNFARELLAEQRVCVVPGSAFGPGGEGYVRVSLSVGSETLLEGLARLATRVREAAAA
jgi:aspartate aminotransferase